MPALGATRPLIWRGSLRGTQCRAHADVIGHQSHVLGREAERRETHAWIAQLVRGQQAMQRILSVGPASLYWTRPAATGPKHDNQRC